jgi:hypothetical protein
MLARLSFSARLLGLAMVTFAAAIAAAVEEQAAAETESASGQVLDSAHSLSQDATKLNGAVDTFLAGVRAA